MFNSKYKKLVKEYEDYRVDARNLLKVKDNLIEEKNSLIEGLKKHIQAKDEVITELNRRNGEKSERIDCLMSEIAGLKAKLKRNNPRDSKGHFLTTKEVETPSHS